MGMNSGIEWTDNTFNMVHGCCKVHGSPACLYCYAWIWDTRKLYEKALTLNPQGVEAITGLGYCDLDREKFMGAVERFKSALKVAPDYGDALIGIAESYKIQGQKTQALDYYHRYLVAQPHGAASAPHGQAARSAAGKSVQAFASLLHPDQRLGHDDEITSAKRSKGAQTAYSPRGAKRAGLHECSAQVGLVERHCNLS